MPRKLPDIRELTDDPSRDWGASATSTASWLFIAASLALCAWSAAEMWSWRALSNLPAYVHAVFALAGILVPLATVTYWVRTDGRTFGVLLAVVLPVVTWIVAVLLAVVGVPAWRSV